MSVAEGSGQAVGRRRVVLYVLMAAVLFSGCGAHKVWNQVDAAGDTGIVSNKANQVQAVHTLTIDDNTGVVSDTLADVFSDCDTQSARITQVIYNQPVKILEKRDNWIRVNTLDGCTGWVRSKYISQNCSSIMSEKYKSRVIVTCREKNIYSGSESKALLKSVVMGTEFFSGKKAGDRYEVILPGGKTGWIDLSGTIQVPASAAIPQSTSLDFVTAAGKFKGAAYMNGGLSLEGIDSSGLIYICSRINGIDLPRDADAQFLKGVSIELEEVQPGDIVFFYSGEGFENITDAGIYIGNDEFIHANKTKSTVSIDKLSNDYYKNRLAGVKRIF